MWFLSFTKLILGFRIIIEYFFSGKFGQHLNLFGDWWWQGSFRIHLAIFYNLLIFWVPKQWWNERGEVYCQGRFPLFSICIIRPWTSTTDFSASYPRYHHQTSWSSLVVPRWKPRRDYGMTIFYPCFLEDVEHSLWIWMWLSMFFFFC